MDQPLVQDASLFLSSFFFSCHVRVRVDIGLDGWCMPAGRTEVVKKVRVR